MKAATARLAAMPPKTIAAPVASPRTLMPLRSGTRRPPCEPPERRRRDEHHGVEPRDMEAGGADRRRDEPRDIDRVHREERRGERAEEQCRALRAAKKQDGE